MRVLITTIIFSFLSAVSLAEKEIVDATDGAVIKISSKQPNLIEAMYGKIAAFVFSEGMFTQTIDDEAGVVYFRPINEGPRSGFVEVIDKNNNRQRYSLILVPDDMQEAQRIVINDNPVVTTANTSTIVKRNDYLQEIKSLMRLMIDDQQQTRKVNEETILIGNISLSKTAYWEQNNLAGEEYKLKNNHHQEFIINEANFLFNKNILAIAAVKNTLASFETTNLYIVKINQEH